MKTTYYITFAFISISFIFISLDVKAQSNDCASAITLTPTFNSCNGTGYSIPTSFTRDAIAAASCVTNGNNREDGWFAFTAIGTTTTITATTNRNVALAIYSGTCGALTEVGCVNNAISLFSESITITTTVGTTYLIRVIRFNSGLNDTMSGNICAFSPPPNDECAGAIELPVGQLECSFTTGSNVGSTHSSVPDASCAGSFGAEDVWYRFTAPAGGQVAIDMQSGSMNDSGLALYSGTCGSLNEIECNDDGASGNMSRIVRYDVTPGATYYLRVWEFGGGTGTFDICVQNQYSDCNVSLPICSSTSFNTNSFGEGNIDNDFSAHCFDGNNTTERQSIWINFEIQTSGDLSFEITPQDIGDDYDFVLFRAESADFCTSMNASTDGSVPAKDGTMSSCNYSDDSGVTGANGGSGSNSQGALGTAFNDFIPAIAGERYFLMINNYSVSSTGFDLSFGGSTAGLDCTILPLELTEFRGEKVKENNLLHWATINEFNTSHFEIERSSDAMDFVKIGMLANDHSSIEQKIYQFWDHEPQNGVNYYRLKQVDQDGTFTYSRTIALDNTGDIMRFEIQKIYPNPTQHQLNYVLATPKASDLKIEVFNSRGERVTTLNQQLNKGVHTIPHSTLSLAKGLYVVKMTDIETGQTLIEKFVKQ